MSLVAGTRFGPYEIISPLGSGGMGEVYRARDTRLGRDVAIKVLPQHLSAQPEIRARFEREAKTISSLNHPNICVLFDVGREGDTDFLVMELIEGDTLTDRLKRGPLPASDLLRFGVQIADALDRAHRAGVIHRDLKPGNIMITRSGAKLMDFGLSRATGTSAAAGGSGASMTALTQSPTMAQALTTQGTLVGTFQYMAPEQLEGRDADVRSDIWSLGCVLYEMATGRRSFDGRSQASLIAAILEREPASIGELPSGSVSSGMGGPPAGMERLIRNCLAKDPEERIQTAHDVRLQLQGIAEGVGLAGTSVSSASSVTAAPAMPLARSGGGTSRVAWGLAALGFLAAASVFAWLYPRTRVPSPPAIRFRAGTIPGVDQMFWPRVSPDGKFLVIDASDSAGVTRAYVRPMDQLEAHPIPGTEGLVRAYWSPDSREIAFVAGGKIQRVPIAGGSPVIVCAAPGGADLSWGSKGQILMDGTFLDSLRIVPAGGGELQPATRIYRDDDEVGSAWPSFLPDGEHFLFIGNLTATASGGNIRLGKLGSLDSKLLGRSDGRVEYAPGDWVLFVRGGSLMAQKLDLKAGKLTGQPITLTDQLQVGSSAGHFSTSLGGILAFARNDGGEAMALHRAGSSGALEGPALASGLLANPMPDSEGRRLLYERAGQAVGAGGEIYVLDLERGTDTRLTFTGNQATTPHWSPDERRFAYATRSSAGSAVLRIGSADGLGTPDSILVPAGLGANLTQWSPAGSRLVFWSGTAKAFYAPTDGSDRAAKPLLDSTQVIAQTRISPDGRWIVGVMGNSPNFHVFVQSLNGPPGRWQISSTPGIWPRWIRGGKGLVYEGMDGRLMTVDIDTSEGFRAGTPRPLFQLPTRSFGPGVSSWGCDENGETFYLIVPPRTTSAGTIEIVSDFQSLVSRR